ncbi:ogr/Delta-like zinc finger family protein [Serratia marcescens]|uniref:ogr/Delta-like zinc finger family protein n=1 Tax=Serratia marcescens TaxID=615 RepID=UPI00114F9C2F|nr:ogr/Delta-like zinc finger family protein [Serratia marcescens]QDI24240.1 ogr/Delta-like zinc finger family protein [Serratia marcescens]
MRVMKVYCPECGESAIIRKTCRKDKKLSDLYCACSDVECGHTFVLNVTFSHTISPSAKTGNSLVKSLLSLLRPDEKQMALDLLQSQPG